MVDDVDCDLDEPFLDARDVLGRILSSHQATEVFIGSLSENNEGRIGVGSKCDDDIGLLEVITITGA